MQYRFGEFTLDEERYELRAQGDVVEVQRLVLETLLYLVKNRNRVVSKEELVERLWRGTAITDASLTQAVFLARRAIGDSASTQHSIKTLRGVGFRFVARADEEGADAVAQLDMRAPDSSSLSTRGNFVGRRDELVQLDHGLTQAVRGEGGLVLVTGEPGAGKTTLCSHWARSIARNGLEIVWGRGWEGGGAPAFWPWVQMLRRLLSGRHLESDRGLAHAARGVEELFPELHELSSEGATLEAATTEATKPRAPAGQRERFLRFEAAFRLIERLSLGSPLVLILEDLHCFDELSSLLVQYLAREVVRLPVLMVGTYRSTEPVTFDTASLAERARLRLKGLDSEEIRALVEKHTGQPADAPTLAHLQELTAGNPLLLEEALRSQHARGGGLPASTSTTDAFGLELPERAARAIRAGLAPLPVATRELIGIAAVIGRSFDLPLLRQAAGLTSQECLERLAPAIKTGFVRESGLGRYLFSHAMVQETAYGDLTIERRSSWHQRVGDALESLSGTPSVAQLGHHFLHAARVAGPTKAMHYQKLAAREAKSRLAYEDAIAHYERAIGVLGLQAGREHLESHVGLLLELAEARRAAGRYAHAIETFIEAAAEARKLDDVESMARAIVGYGETQTQVLDPQLNVLTTEVLERLPDEDSIWRARLLGRHAVALNFVPSAWSEREAMSRKALEMARRLGDETTIAYTSNARRWCMSAELDVRELMAMSSEAVERALAIGNASLANESRIWKIADHLQLEERDEFVRERELHSAVTERLREPWHRMVDLRFSAMWAIAQGEFAAGERFVDEAFDAGMAASDGMVEIIRCSQRIALYRDTSRFESLLEFVNFVIQILPAEYSAISVSALIHAEAGRRADAQAALDRLSKDDFAIVPPYLNGMTALAWAADAAHLLGDRAAAAALHRRLSPHAKRSVIGGGAVLFLGPVSYRLGLLAETLGRPDEALAHFQDSAERCRRLGALPLLAWSLFAGARVTTREVHAEAWLRESHEIASKLGMTLLLGKLDARA